MEPSKWLVLSLRWQQPSGHDPNSMIDEEVGGIDVDIIVD